MITIPGVDPLWMWIGFLILVFIMLEIDLGVFNRKDHVIGVRESLIWTGIWITIAMIFNGWLYFQFGSEIALQFFTGYVIEKSLSMDNLFVFLLIFTSFNIPRIYQHRVLFWGILGAIIMRGIFIALGAALVSRFDWIFLLFGLILLWSAWRMEFQKEKKFDTKNHVAVRIARKLFPVTDKLEGHKFFIRENGKRFATVLFVALITIELTDVVFATDSIPAIFAITTDPFLVFTSNIFAILGLRALYFAIAGLHAMFVYLKTGLAAILAFVAGKMLLIGVPSALESLGSVTGIPMPHLPHYHVPITISLTVILGILVLSIIASLIKSGGINSADLIEQDEKGMHVHVSRKKAKEVRRK